MALSRTSSGEITTQTSRTDPLLQPPAAPQERDWEKIGAIAAAAIGGLILALAVLCFQGSFPQELLGGRLGVAITAIIGASILLPAALILFEKYTT